MLATNTHKLIGNSIHQGRGMGVNIIDTHKVKAYLNVFTDCEKFLYTAYDRTNELTLMYNVLIGARSRSINF